MCVLSIRKSIAQAKHEAQNHTNVVTCNSIRLTCSANILTSWKDSANPWDGESHSAEARILASATIPSAKSCAAVRIHCVSLTFVAEQAQFLSDSGRAIATNVSLSAGLIRTRGKIQAETDGKGNNSWGCLFNKRPDDLTDRIIEHIRD